MAIINGSNGSDVLIGTPQDDTLYGYAGDDTLDGAGGHNILFGGNGNDTYLIHSQYDYIFDESGSDNGIIYVNFYKTNTSVEHWAWAPGVEKLPYWIDALIPGDAPGYQALLGPSKTFKYYFATSAPSYFSADDANGFLPFNASQIAFAKQAFAYISSVVDVRYVEASSPDEPNTVVLTNNVQKGSAGYAYYPYENPVGSDLFLNYRGNSAGNLTPADNTYAALALIHELGHTLGLKHPFITANSPPEDGPALPDDEDATMWSVMSYNIAPAQFHLNYSPLDIAALQYLYGPSHTEQTNDTYLLSNTTTNMIWDGGGIDMIDGSTQTSAITLYLEPGYWGSIGQKAKLISAPGQITVNFGTVIEGAIGGSGDDRLYGNVENNTLRGGAGNDLIEGFAGDDLLQGDAGFDKVKYEQNKNNYAISHQITAGMQTFVVLDRTGVDGRDTLQQVERLQFLDVSVGLDIDGAAGQAYRLYQAAFDRTPDLAGLGYWIGEIDHGTTLSAAASSFLVSTEYASRYGNNPTVEQYLTNLYQNVLHRAPDAPGIAYWTTQLTNAAQTRADVLVGFSESNENQAQVIAKIENGIDFIPFGAT